MISLIHSLRNFKLLQQLCMRVHVYDITLAATMILILQKDSLQMIWMAQIYNDIEFI